MLTLGFTNHYYTLWNVTNQIRYGRGEVINGVFTGEVWQVTNYNYIQNLSMDRLEAVKKIAARAGENQWNEDLELRGSGSFVRTKRMIEEMAIWQFTFGKLTGVDMRESEDAWQLNRAMEQEPNLRRRVIARRRLLELGELVRYEHEVDVVIEYKEEDQPCDFTGDLYRVHVPVYGKERRKYATARQAKIMELKKQEAELSGHFFTDGEKVELELKRVGGFTFETVYGTTSVEKYLTKDGKMVKYMGGTPLPIKEEDGFVLVKGTVKHSEYKGVPETKLQRMKIIVKK